MTLPGIDMDWKKDTVIGVGVGVAFAGLNALSGSFALGTPAAQMSVGDAEKFIITGLAAPIFEEGFFRGAIPFFLQKLKMNFWLVNIAQAAMFAIFHLFAYGTGFQAAFVGAFLFGLVAGMLVKYTNSLLPGMIAHAMLNSYLFLKTYISFGGI